MWRRKPVQVSCESVSSLVVCLWWHQVVAKPEAWSTFFQNLRRLSSTYYSPRFPPTFLNSLYSHLRERTVQLLRWSNAMKMQTGVKREGLEKARFLLGEGRMLVAWETGSFGGTSETALLWWSRWSHWMVCTADANGLGGTHSWWLTHGSFKAILSDVSQHLWGHFVEDWPTVFRQNRQDIRAQKWNRKENQLVCSEQIQ